MKSSHQSFKVFSRDSKLVLIINMKTTIQTANFMLWHQIIITKTQQKETKSQLEWETGYKN